MSEGPSRSGASARPDDGPGAPAGDRAPATSAAIDPGLIHRLIDRLAVQFSDGHYAEEATAARAAYFAATGELGEEDGELFEPRMAACLEWYVLERPLSDRGIPPVRALLADEKASLAPHEVVALERLATTRRSLFSIDKVEAGSVTVSDLLVEDAAAITAFERRGTLGFTVGDLCEARICDSSDGAIFTKTLLFHPIDAAAEIHRSLPVMRATTEGASEFLARLARINLRWHRQGHVAADRIYREGLSRPGGGASGGPSGRQSGGHSGDLG